MDDARQEQAQPPLRKSRTDLSLAVVVGAGGMGMAVARRLGERHRLMLADRSRAHLEERTAALREEGHEVLPIVCDVTSAQDVGALADAAQAQGPLGVLAHVVGLSPSMADGRGVMSVNLIGAANVAKAFLPLAGPGSAAIFISSIAGHGAKPSAEVVTLLEEPLGPGLLEQLELAQGGLTSLDAYVLSKFGLMRLVERQAPAWGARGARIVSLSPGLISTPMGDLEFRNLPAKFDMLARTPLQRQGSLLEIADVVDFLASDRASFISGTDILVDGGLNAANRHPRS